MPKPPITILYRRLGAFRLYSVAFALSALSCLALGIITLFSIFAGPFEEQLGYSQAEISQIIIFQTLGMNLLTPLCGYIADVKGIWILSVMALAGYAASFNMVFLILRGQLNNESWVMCIAFFIMGCSHGALLFSCLLNSARSLGQYYKTLAISTPNIMVSFSSFLEMQAMRLFTSHDSQRNFADVLEFFWYTLTLATVVSFLSCKLTDAVYAEEQKRTPENTPQQPLQRSLSNFATSPLLTGAALIIHTPRPGESGSLIGSPGRSPMPWYVDEPPSLNLDSELTPLSSYSADSLDLALVPVVTIHDPEMPYRVKIAIFLHDPFMYPLLCCCMFSIGATEFFIANLGSILSTLGQPDSLHEDLKLLSVAATITRFLIMILTDWLCTRFGMSRLTIFTAMVVGCGVSYLYLALAPVSSMHFDLVVVVSAVLNSGVFTLLPAILASIYGLDILGTTWGLFSASAIFGNIFFNLLYSYDFTARCVAALQTLAICSTLTFVASGVILLAFGTLILAMKSGYIARAGEDF